MTTLLLRLAGPMQSWGVQSRFAIRDTLTEPSKSGVIGLLCAALGRDRAKPIDDLATLRMGVRVDREGAMRYDYQIAGIDGYYRAKGIVERTNPIPSTRYYLADASFLVGFEGESHDLMVRIHNALRNPVWPLFLGRKAFVPGLPVWIKNGLVKDSLDNALLNFPAVESRLRYRRENDRATFRTVRFVLEDDGRYGPHEGIRLTRPDQPVSFQPRTFSTREVIIKSVDTLRKEVSNVPE